MNDSVKELRALLGLDVSDSFDWFMKVTCALERDYGHSGDARCVLGTNRFLDLRNCLVNKYGGSSMVKWIDPSVEMSVYKIATPFGWVHIGCERGMPWNEACFLIPGGKALVIRE